MNNQIFLTYCLTIFIASMIPGPSSMLALTQGARYGWIAGVFSGFGNVVASVVQGVVAYALVYQLGGISSEFLNVIKYIGAAYIIYLGVSLFKVNSFGSGPGVMAENKRQGLIKCFYDGFAFAIFNPKALTFFAAMFPQFISDKSVDIGVVAVVFLPIALIALACFMFYVFAGKLIMNFMSKTQHIGKFFGGVIVLSGMVFLLS